MKLLRGHIAGWAIAAVLLIPGPALAAPQDGRDIIVHVQKNGARIIVDVDFPVQATSLEAWNVMTDYDNMWKFISNLESSRVIGRDANTLMVEQKCKASRGPLSITFENVREIVLTPPREVSLNWERFAKLLARYPLLRPRITHAGTAGESFD